MYERAKLTNAAEVFLKDLSTGALTFMGCITESSWNKTIEVTDLRCGIEAGLAGLSYTNPDMTVTIATIAWNDYLIQMQNDEDWATGVSLSVPKHTAPVPLVTATLNGTYTFSPAVTPVGGTMYFQDTNGQSYPVVYVSPTATVTGGAGLTGTFSWMEAVTTAETFDFKTGSLPKATGLIMHHVAYSLDTNEPLADVYFVFDKVVGDGSLEMSMTIGNTAGTTVTLRALSDSGKFMRQIYVPRA